MKEESCKDINECVELQKEESLQQIDGTSKTYNSVFVNSFVIIDPD